MALEVGQARGNYFALVFLPEKGRLKVKLANCLQKHKNRGREGAQCSPCPLGMRPTRQFSPPMIFSQRKKKKLPILSDRKRICWTAESYTFCLHLLVYCGLVTGLFFSLASSLAVHLKVAHILLLPLMVSKRPYLRVNSHLWSSHNDKVVLLRVLLLAKNLLLQKSKAISKIIYWTLHSE